jgi:sensor histidine kinase YesM
LLGLRERARLANGELTIESEPGEGTTLTMWIQTNDQPTDNWKLITDNEVVA